VLFDASSVTPLQDAAATLGANAVAIESLPQDRIERRIEAYTEWRDARRVDVADAVAVEVPVSSNATQLRFGVAGMGDVAGTVDVQVLVNDEAVEGFRYTGSAWHDVLIDLPASPEHCRVMLTGSNTVWLSGLEAFTANTTKPNVLVVLIDTLRADHLSCYGYARKTSPHMDALAQDGIVCTQLIAQSSWTRPSVATLLTGMYPHVHGAQDRGDLLKKDVPKLADAFEAGGYRSVGFMTNPNCIPYWGFGDEFDRYVDVNSADFEEADDANVVDAALATAKSLGDRPWFMYVHTMGPHDPYIPPAPYDTMFDAAGYDNPRWDCDDATRKERMALMAQYDGEIAYSDAQLGRLIDHLKEAGAYDNTLILVTSDHGEEFWEHGFEKHGHTLYDELIKVPGILKLPGNRLAGSRRDIQLEMVDLAPTLLALADLPAEPQHQGMSVVDMLDSGQGATRVAYSSLVLNAFSRRAGRTPAHKYLVNLRHGTEQWFDLAQDPGEFNPLERPFSQDYPLRSAAQRVAARGAGGLHILITNDGTTVRRITGRIGASNIAGHEISYVDEFKESLASAEGIDFSITMPKDEDGLGVSNRWKRALAVDYIYQKQVEEIGGEIFSEQDHAHLRVDVPMDGQIALDLKVNGASIPVERIYVGARRQNAPLDEATFTPQELLGAAESYEPSVVPKGFGVFVWYVAGTEAIADGTLDPSMREALDALGYIE
jgi:arylsulfatase A-like enzyme